MEELQKNSKARLTDRGGKRIEELMRIEKMDKHVKKDLPILTERLRKRLLEWEKAPEEGNGAPFLYQGMPYLDTMEAEEDAWIRHREAQRLEKEQKKKEELERYRDSHGGPGGGVGGGREGGREGGGNLLPRASLMGSGVKTPGKKAGSVLPLSARKGEGGRGGGRVTPSKVLGGERGGLKTPAAAVRRGVAAATAATGAASGAGDENLSVCSGTFSEVSSSSSSYFA